jgi:hypothetical protein
MLLGIHEDNPLSVPPINTLGPTFLGALSPLQFLSKFKATCQAAWSKGMIPVMTFKPSLSSVATGKWDAVLLAAGAWALKPIYIYPWHEPENDMNAADFTKMFNRVYKHLSSGTVKVGYASMAYQWRPGSPTTATPALWRPARVDFWASDVYSGKSFPDTATLATHAGFQRWWHLCAEGAPFIITERGFHSTGQARADVIHAEDRWLQSQPVRGYLYWSTPGTENDPAWVLDPISRMAVKDLLADLATK